MAQPKTSRRLSEDAALADLRTVQDCGPDLAAIHVRSGTDDDVCQPVLNELAFIVDDLRGVFRPVVIAAHDRRAFDADLAALPVPQNLAGLSVLDDDRNYDRQRSSCALLLQAVSVDSHATTGLREAQVPLALG